MTSSSGTERLTYLTNGELREEITYAAGGDPSRYGAGSDRGLNKADMLRVAEQLQPADSDLDLHEADLEMLYEVACEWAGGEYDPNAGNPWKINRENLKQIHQTIGGRDPREIVADGGERPPACPTCSRRMAFSEPSHETPYWTCPRDHEPPGIVLRRRDVEYAFALARVRLLDTFDEGRLDVFEGVERPGDVAGIATENVLERMETCVGHKQMRQRKEHDDTPGDARPTAGSPEQSGLGRWSA